MSKKLTQEQMTKYIESDGKRCPFCNGDRLLVSLGYLNHDMDGIDYEYIKGDDGQAWMSATCKCKDCGEYWRDGYKLAAIWIN